MTQKSTDGDFREWKSAIKTVWGYTAIKVLKETDSDVLILATDADGQQYRGWLRGGQGVGMMRWNKV